MSGHLTFEANQARLEELHRYAAEARRGRIVFRRRRGLRRLLTSGTQREHARTRSPRSAHETA